MPSQSVATLPLPVADAPVSPPTSSDAPVAQEQVSPQPNPAFALLAQLESPKVSPEAAITCQDLNKKAPGKSMPKAAPKSKAASPTKSKNSKSKTVCKTKNETLKKTKGNKKLPMQRFTGVSKSVQAQFPDGCSRCRWRAGCTRSCWTRRGYKC